MTAKKLMVLLITLFLVVGVYACTVVPTIVPGQNQSQVQSQGQSQSQKVSVTVEKEIRALGVGDAQQYSRLVYPGEVLTFPVVSGAACQIISAYPVGLYTIGGIGGYGKDMVQTEEAKPTYDPIRHRMEFGVVPVIDKIDYWTMKAILENTVGDYCVLDNRGPDNRFTTVEVTVYEPAFI